jgi:dipeptidyl aminopeptidase/acylaminoacyl peptidase
VSKRTVPCAAILILSLFWSVPGCDAQERKKRFTVADEIGLTYFLGGSGGKAKFSPDGKYFAVCVERGRLDLNRVEDNLRFYRSEYIKRLLEDTNELQSPSPVWVTSSMDYSGSSITDWRWLRDSSGVAFLERAANGNRRLVFADLTKKAIEPLTSVTESVKQFDIRDPQHYVYTVTDPAVSERVRAERRAPAIVGTGRYLLDLLFPEGPSRIGWLSRRNYLWAVVDGKRFEVKHDGAPLVPEPEGYLALSPDGRSLVTTLPVPEVPASWETLYPPPFASSRIRIHAGHQDLDSIDGSVQQYVLINLKAGSVRALTDAPAISISGWWTLGVPSSWSSDGQEVLLPGTFISSKDRVPTRPCVAVVKLSSNTRTCVEILKGRTESGVEEGFHVITDARFVEGGRQRIALTSIYHGDNSLGTTEYRQTPAGGWEVAELIKGEPVAGHDGLDVIVKQGLNQPPLLVAKYKETSRTIWDPNPQLKDIEMGEASVYEWKDREGRRWRGGLFKPNSYESGRRYPLVIQTHGFAESEFRPSGLYPTAFAARALGATGMVVLQVSEPCPIQTTDEGPCAVYGYEVAAHQLISEGLADPDRIGIIGFSRTCFYVMEMLTTGSVRLKAASITDGVMGSYLQHMIWGGGHATDAEAVIGAKPFGQGLQEWIKRSPGFNLDRVNAPLLVNAEGRAGVLFMWEPYAGLHYLHKPVDLIMLNSNDHILTNPAVRMASQGGSVDWFRFWLQDYEDPDPAKAEQYNRWHELRTMQIENEKKLTAPSPTSK